MSEVRKAPGALTKGHWGRELSKAEAAEYGPLGQMDEYNQMKDQGGNKVQFEGTLYYRQNKNTGSTLGVAVGEAISGKPILVVTPPGLPEIQGTAKVRVYGRVAEEPFANAG